jgi:peptidoglycan/xylan/chitin deacetylase (PgdA/CDA1 family)
MTAAATRAQSKARRNRAITSVARRVFRDRDPAHRNVILCYHSISPSAPYASATPDEFDRHLDWLHEHCDVVPLHAIGARSRGRPQVALTFDDGYADNWDYAVPRLEARGLVATFYVTVGLIERAPGVVEKVAHLWGAARDQIETMQWGQLCEMAASGMGIGSHTWSHPNLAALSRAGIARELRYSKDCLEDRLQQPVDSVAYPFGKPRHHVTDAVVAVAREVGFSCGVAVLPRAVAPTDDRLRLPRITVGDDDVDALRAKVTGDNDWHAHVHERAPGSLARMAVGRRAERGA